MCFLPIRRNRTKAFCLRSVKARGGRFEDWLAGVREVSQNDVAFHAIFCSRAFNVLVGLRDLQIVSLGKDGVAAWVLGLELVVSTRDNVARGTFNLGEAFVFTTTLRDAIIVCRPELIAESERVEEPDFDGQGCMQTSTNRATLAVMTRTQHTYP